MICDNLRSRNSVQVDHRFGAEGSGKLNNVASNQWQPYPAKAPLEALPEPAAEPAAGVLPFEGVV
jgi:hypothetical protein